MENIFSRTICTFLRGFRHILNFSGFLGAAMSLDHWAGLHLFHPPVSGGWSHWGFTPGDETDELPAHQAPGGISYERGPAEKAKSCNAMPGGTERLKPEKMHVLRCGSHSQRYGALLCAQLGLVGLVLGRGFWRMVV